MITRVLLAVGIAAQSACALRVTQGPEAGAPQASETAAVPKATGAPVTELLSAGDLLVIPMQVVNGYILVDGQVNGLAGTFMFDTGNPFNRTASPR